MANVPSGQVSCFLPTRTARLLKGQHHHTFARKTQNYGAITFCHNSCCVTFILFLIMIGHSQSPPRSAQRGKLLSYWWKQEREKIDETLDYWWEADQRDGEAVEDEWEGEREKKAHHSPLLILICKTGQHSSENPRGVWKHCRTGKVHKFPEIFIAGPARFTNSLRYLCQRASQLINSA